MNLVLNMEKKEIMLREERRKEKVKEKRI